MIFFENADKNRSFFCFVKNFTPFVKNVQQICRKIRIKIVCASYFFIFASLFETGETMKTCCSVNNFFEKFIAENLAMSFFILNTHTHTHTPSITRPPSQCRWK